jgi:hypothetical protein
MNATSAPKFKSSTPCSKVIISAQRGRVFLRTQHCCGVFGGPGPVRQKTASESRYSGPSRRAAVLHPIVIPFPNRWSPPGGCHSQVEAARRRRLHRRHAQMLSGYRETDARAARSAARHKLPMPPAVLCSSRPARWRAVCHASDSGPLLKAWKFHQIRSR